VTDNCADLAPTDVAAGSAQSLPTPVPPLSIRRYRFLAVLPWRAPLVVDFQPSDRFARPAARVNYSYNNVYASLLQFK